MYAVASGAIFALMAEACTVALEPAVPGVEIVAAVVAAHSERPRVP